MAQYNNHRRRLATQEEQPPSLIPPPSKDPTLKGESYMFSPRQNSVLTKAKSLKHYKTPTFLGNLFQAKSMTLSADLGPSGGVQLEPSRPKQQMMSKEIKNPIFKERVEGEKVKVKFLQEEGNKDVYFVVKDGKGKDFKDPVGDLRRLSLGGGGIGRRRSFCGAHVELRDFLSNNGAKVVAVDMPPFMQIHAVDCARMTHDSLEKFSSKSLALTLKKEFDGVYGPAWHCIVGTSFGSFVTHSVGGFLYFSMDQKLYILLFKTTVQRAD